MAASTTARVALITASSAGLGAAIAHSLAPHYRIVLNYFSRPAKAESVIASASKITPLYQLPSGQPRFHAIQGDASKQEDIKRIVAESVEKMGRLDVVVSNNGWTRLTNFFDLEDQVKEADWDHCFEANVKGHLWLFYAAKDHLIKSAKESKEDKSGVAGGAFVTVASIAGVKPSGSSLPYSVTKAAEIHLTKGLAVIAGGSGVRCNSVSPGLMLTEW
jgi:NAD(P)-dependent dehydrogenase (short-subunit alcohol dehydrogenase family)